MLPYEFLNHVTPMMNYGYIQKRWMERHLSPICEKNDLKLSELSLIVLLHLNKEIKTAKDVAKFSELKRGNISVLVENMCKRGFVEQKSVENDRRLREIILTEKCADILAECEDVIELHLKTTFSGIPKEDLDLCEKVFMKMYNNLLNCEENLLGSEEK